MKLLAIPNFGDRISPRLDYSGSLHLVTIEGKKEIKRETIKLVCNTNLERLNLILALKPNIIICNGISDLLLNELEHNNIDVIPWVHGEVNDIINNYLRAKVAKPLKTNYKEKNNTK